MLTPVLMRFTRNTLIPVSNLKDTGPMQFALRQSLIQFNGSRIHFQLFPVTTCFVGSHKHVYESNKAMLDYRTNT